MVSTSRAWECPSNIPSLQRPWRNSEERKQPQPPQPMTRSIECDSENSAGSSYPTIFDNHSVYGTRSSSSIPFVVIDVVTTILLFPYLNQEMLLVGSGFNHSPDVFEMCASGCLRTSNVRSMQRAWSQGWLRYFQAAFIGIPCRNPVGWTHRMSRPASKQGKGNPSTFSGWRL